MVKDVIFLFILHFSHKNIKGLKGKNLWSRILKEVHRKILRSFSGVDRDRIESISLSPAEPPTLKNPHRKREDSNQRLRIFTPENFTVLFPLTSKILSQHVFLAEEHKRQKDMKQHQILVNVHFSFAGSNLPKLHKIKLHFKNKSLKWDVSIKYCLTLVSLVTLVALQTRLRQLF